MVALRRKHFRRSDVREDTLFGLRNMFKIAHADRWPRGLAPMPIPWAVALDRRRDKGVIVQY
jgi:hypothetical protein